MAVKKAKQNRAVGAEESEKPEAVAKADKKAESKPGMVRINGKWRPRGWKPETEAASGPLSTKNSSALVN